MAFEWKGHPVINNSMMWYACHSHLRMCCQHFSDVYFHFLLSSIYFNYYSIVIISIECWCNIFISYFCYQPFVKCQIHLSIHSNFHIILFMPIFFLFVHSLWVWRKRFAKMIFRANDYNIKTLARTRH